MKKYITLSLLILFTSCVNETEVTITKVSGSPEYVNAKLSLEEPIITEDGYEFSFDVINYELGMQTLILNIVLLTLQKVSIYISL